MVTTARAATSKIDSNGSRLSVRSKSDHSEKLQRLQSPKVVIPQADLKPTEIIRQQINSASKTGRRSSKDYSSRPKSIHYSNKGKFFAKTNLDCIITVFRVILRIEKKSGR